MKKEITDQLISKYLDNECSLEEAERVERWLADPQNRAKVDQVMRSQWEKTSAPGSEKEPDPYQLLDKIHQSIHAQGKAISNDRRKYRYPGQWLKIAATILLPMLFVGLYYHFNPYTETETPIAYSLVENETGQRSKIRLPDGSAVWLNAESKLQFPKRFENHAREVLLEGEAFFEVVKDPTSPFTVKTATIDVKVLGTSFNVSAFPGSRSVETTLVTGSVALKKVDSNEDFLRLEPNQKASYDKEAQSFSIEDVDATFFTSWKDGYLKFQDAPFDHVIEKLQRWYGVKIKYNQVPRGSHNLTFTLKDESLEKILDLMSTLIHMEYTIESKNVKIELQ